MRILPPLRFVLRAFALLLCAVLTRTPAHAATEGPFGDWFHSAWNAGDGAPTDVQELAQTPDGWLWAASSAGLYRFDGNRWERMTAIDGNVLPQTNIMSVAVVDGALWVGYQFGGISRFKDGQARHYGRPEGLKESTLFSILGTSSGKVLVALPLGVFELQEERWVRVWPRLTPKENRFAVELAEIGGDVWLATETGLLVRRKGAADFETVLEGEERMPLVRGPHEAVWTVSGKAGALRFDRARGRFVPLGRNASDIGALYAKRDGTVWAVRGDALELVDPATLRPIDRLTPARGLSSSDVIRFFEDREGNLWVVTTSGIDRLRRNRLQPLRIPLDVRTPGAAPAADGGVWVSSSQNVPVRHVAADGTITELPIRDVQSLTATHDGVAWFANAREVLRIDRGGRQRFAVPDADDNAVHNMAPARDGGLWLSLLARMTIHHLKDGVWTDRKDLVPYERSTPLFLHEDARGRLWQGYTRNRLAVADADGKRIERYDAGQGLRTGNVTAVADGSGGRMWIGGERALMVLADGRLTTVAGPDGRDFIGVSGIVQLANGDLWLNGLEGLTRIPAAELARAARSRDWRVAFERLDFKDGLDGVAPQIRPLPSLRLAPDGRLWYVTANAVGSVDPARRRRNAVAPPVQVLNVNVDGAEHAAGSGLRLPPRPGTVQIDYTALSLTMPERMRFRYRLEGVDAAWQDAGNRRSAFYTGLGPGDYRFRVQAANEDGVWNVQGATLAFGVAPTLAQTPWFRALCAVLALGAAWLLYRLRLRRLAAALKSRYEARIEERERIARELHDTLLQSVQGMVYKVDAAVAPLADDDPLRARLEGALDRARQGIAEARDKVRELRSDRPGDLVALVRGRGDELAHDGAARFVLDVAGEPRPLLPDAFEQVSRILCEALENAFRHAGAHTVAVRVAYGPDQLAATVRDDGAGIPAAVRAAGRRDGHFGIVGMQERARRIHARLVLDSRDAGGTVWHLTLPARIAFGAAPTPFARLRARLAAGWRDPVLPA